MAHVIEKQLHLNIVSFCYDWGLRDLSQRLGNEAKLKKTNSGFEWDSHADTFCALAGFGSVLLYQSCS